MNSKLSPAVAMEGQITIPDRTGRAHQLTPLASLVRHINRIDLFVEDGEFTLWRGCRRITDGDRSGAEPAHSTDHTDLTTAEIENNPG